MFCSLLMDIMTFSEINVFRIDIIIIFERKRHFLENVYFRRDHREKTVSSKWPESYGAVSVCNVFFTIYLRENGTSSRLYGSLVFHSTATESSYELSADDKNLCNEPIYSHTFVLNLSRLSINIYMQIIEDLEMKAVITNAMQLHIEMLCIFINSVYRKWILWSVLSRTLILIFTSFLENFA